MKTRKMLSKIFCALLVIAMIATTAPLMGFATDSNYTSKPNYISNIVGGVKITFDNVGDSNVEYEIYRKTPTTDYVKIGNAEILYNGSIRYLDYNVEHLEFYTYDVAVSGGELSGTPITVQYIKAPEFSANISSEGLVVNIEHIEGVDYYAVLRTDVNTGALKFIGRVDQCDNPRFVDTTIKESQNYDYIVRAYLGSGFSYYYLHSAVVVKSGITGLANTNRGVKISYDKIPNAVSYTIYRKTDTTDWVAVETFKARSYYYTVDYSAVSGTVYYYSITATLADGTTNLNMESMKIMYLEDPSLFLSIDDGIVVDFTPIPGADYYDILRTPAGVSSFKTVGNVLAGEQCTFTDTTAVEGESYTYAVRARNNSTGVLYTGYLQTKTIDYAIFTYDDVIAAEDDTAIVIATDTKADDTAAVVTTDETTPAADEAKDDVAAAEKTVTDILTQVVNFIGQILTKLGVDASFLDNILPVVNTIFGFVNNIISIAA